MAAPRIQLIISESNISIPNNTSVLTGTLYYYGNGETYNQNTSCSITINGDTKSFTVSIAKNTSGVIGSHSVTVTHDADGNKTVNYSAVVNASAHYGASTTSGSYACTWIKRATQPSLSPAVVKYGESTTISLPRADSGFVHDLYYSVGNGWIKFKSSAGTSYTWTVPKTLATSGKESSTKTIVIRAVTLSGGSSVGEKTINLSVNPSADMVPGLSIKIEDTTGNYTKFGAYVRAQSKIKCTLTETLSYESPIKSRSIEIDGVKYTQNPATSNVIAYTDKSVTATITDGRGMSTTKSVKPAVLDWWAPTVTRFSVARCNSAGTLQADGAYTRVDYAVKIAPLNNKNTKSATVRYKKQSDPDTAWKNVSAAVDGYTYQGYVVLPTSSEFTYDIELSVSDYFMTTPVPGVIGTAFTLMDWHASGKGMAIGKVAEKENLFDVAMPTKIQNTLTVKSVDMTITDAEYNELVNLLGGGVIRLIDWIYPVGHVITTVNPDYDPNKIFKTHTWVRFAAGRTLVGVNESDTAFATAKKTGGEKTHKLTASEMPGHEHDVRQEGNTGRLYIGTGHSSGNYYSMILSGNAAWADDISWGGRVKTHSAGNSEPHNNMPPYITVYFWKRTK